MIEFENFVSEDGFPIYLQILLYIKRGVVAGTIVDGDELPSRRVLSALLGINPNTVQKAFKMLEDEHLIESKTGAKSLMTLTEETIERLKEELLSNDIKGIIKALKMTGIGRDDAVHLITKYWEE